MKTDNYGDLFLARHKFRLLIRGWRCVPCSGRLSPCFHLERRSLCRSNESDVTYCLLTFPALPLRTYNFPPLPLSSSLHPVSSAKVTIASRMILSYDILFNSVSFCIFCLIMLSRILQSFSFTLPWMLLIVQYVSDEQVIYQLWYYGNIMIITDDDNYDS